MTYYVIVDLDIQSLSVHHPPNMGVLWPAHHLRKENFLVKRGP